MDNSRAWRFAPAQFQATEIRQNSNIVKYESVMLSNINNTDYMMWNNVPEKYGKIVNIWNDDRNTSVPTITGFSYAGVGSRNIVIHFSSAYSGKVCLGLLYMPGI